MHCYTVKNQGNRLFESGNWPEARAKYENAIRITWSEHWQDRWKLPSDAATLTPLMDVAPKPWLDSVACANNIAQCYLKEGNRLMVRAVLGCTFFPWNNGYNIRRWTGCKRSITCIKLPDAFLGTRMKQIIVSYDT